jgi:hypothetical protein
MLPPGTNMGPNSDISSLDKSRSTQTFVDVDSFTSTASRTDPSDDGDDSDGSNGSVAETTQRRSTNEVGDESIVRGADQLKQDVFARAGDGDADGDSDNDSNNYESIQDSIPFEQIDVEDEWSQQNKTSGSDNLPNKSIL